MNCGEPSGEQSKALIKWAALITADDAIGFRPNQSNDLMSLEVDFERLNGWRDDLDTFANYLRGHDLAVRRAAARVIGSIRNRLGSQSGDWHVFRSKELELAGKYVLDRDQETAANATTAFIELLGGEPWDHWNEFQSNWVLALGTVHSPQSRNLAKLFAFTPVPTTGSVPGLYRLFRSGDPETSSLAMCSLSRASIFEPIETEETILKDVSSGSAARRRRTFKDLEALSSILWDSEAAYRYVQYRRDEVPYAFQTAWVRCTMRTTPDPNWRKSRHDGHMELLDVLGKGLADSDAAIRISSARALIPIGKRVDIELGSGPMASPDKTEVARSLFQAAAIVQRDDPVLAKQARDLATGFDRMRAIG
jgi:hypothetical protein